MVLLYGLPHGFRRGVGLIEGDVESSRVEAERLLKWSNLRGEVGAAAGFWEEKILQ